MLNWIKRFNIFCLLDNHNYSFQHHEYDLIIAAGASTSIISNQLNDVNSLLEQKEWAFGHICYEYSAPQRQGTTTARVPFPTIHFFIPQHLLYIRRGILVIRSATPDLIFDEIWQTSAEADHEFTAPVIQATVSREEYLSVIEELKRHLLRGNCYEINYCIEFFAEQFEADPSVLYLRLMNVSPTPFAAFYRLHDQYLICASPERFLKRVGQQIISQPMKGTSRRMPEQGADQFSKEALRSSEKETAENVMVVDMVRNDLTRICKQGSVHVTDLFDVQTFPQVHQMISTVAGELGDHVNFSDIINATFPMGSMTGAPKDMVMKLIHQYENSPRGLYSGTLGFITPDGDFDFNVVIRSILYDDSNKVASFKVGSGITYYSEAAHEWEECQLKASAIKKVLTEGPALT